MIEKQKEIDSKKIKIEKILLENFADLQKVMVDLSLKLGDLTGKISRLLELFETSAKSISEKDFDLNQDNKRVIEKIDSMIEQNKTIAKGLSTIYENKNPFLEPRKIQPMPGQAILRGYHPSIQNNPPLNPKFKPSPKRQNV
jgi:hypothetical protein